MFRVHFSLLALALLISKVLATALTFVLEPQDKSCYYGDVRHLDTKIGFYFAVQSGGSFDVDYSIKGPNGQVIHSEEKVRQTEFVFNGEDIGEYEFCFSNTMSTFAQKVVDFEINFESSSDDFKAELPKQAVNVVKEEADSMENSLDNLNRKVTTLLREMQYYKTRNHRNQATVKSTETRIFWFSIFDVFLMASMSGLQVAIVQLFFKGSRKNVV